MKKTFKFYLVVWATLLAAFNAIVFLARSVIPGFVVVYDARFWIVWSFIIISFTVNLISANMAFKEENLQKLFYNISLINTSYGGAVAMFVIGTILMLIPNCPYWIAAIVCIIIAIFNVFSVISAKVAVDAVSAVDTKIKVQTFFIKSLTADADNIMARATTPEIKAECKKVYESVRYSDPMSNDALAAIEGQISIKFNDFSEAVCNSDLDKVTALAKELTILIGDRNNKCKLLK